MLENILLILLKKHLFLMKWLKIMIFIFLMFPKKGL